MSSRPSLFRQQALEHYAQNREKHILPRLARPPVFLLLWILIGLAGFSLLLLWLDQVPIYIHGSGIITEQHLSQNRQSLPSFLALVFVPVTPTHPLQIHVGTPVQLQIGTQGQPFTGTVAAIGPAILSPQEIQQRYAPGRAVEMLATDPSLVVSVAVGTAFSSQAYPGSLVTAEVEAGSTSVLSSLFGFVQ